MPTFKIVLQEQGSKKAKKNVDGLGLSLKGLAKKAGAMAVGFVAVNKAFDAVSASIQAAGKFEGVSEGFENLRKKTGFSSQAFDKFNKALDGTVQSTELMTMANNAMLLGITDNEQQMAQMFDTAQRLAKAVGEDAAFGVNSLVTGIGRQSKLMLDNLGIMIDTQQAYDDYAASLGKTASQLDETERKQAFTNAALAEAERLANNLGEEQLNMSDSLNQANKAVGDVSVSVGQLLSTAVIVLASGFTGAMKAVDGFLDSLKDVDTEEAAMSGSLEVTRKALAQVKEEMDSFNSMELRFNPMGFEALQAEFLILTDRLRLLESMSEAERENFFRQEEQQQRSNELRDEAMQAEELQFTDRQVRYDLDFNAFEKVEKSKASVVLKRQKTELDADAKLMREKLKNAATSHQSASDGAKSVIKGESMKAISGLIASILRGVPYPANIFLAATAGGAASALIDKGLAQIPEFAQGGSFVTGGDQLIRVGDNATGRELVNVVPLDAAGETTGGGGMINVNISGSIMSESYTEDVIIPHIKEALRRGESIS